MEATLCERDPHVHLRGNYYPILTGMHEKGCAGEKRVVLECSRDRADRRGTTLSERPVVTLLEFVSQPKPTASGAVGVCPFHDDNHPSFGVNTEGDYWHFFAGCGGGSVTSRRL